MIREVLEKLSSGHMSLDEAEKALKTLAIEQVGELAKLDVGREIRHGIPEVIIAEGKTPDDVVDIVTRALDREGRATVSRATKEHIKALKPVINRDVLFYKSSNGSTIVIERKDSNIRATGGKVGIITAGTSDIDVAEEAKVIAMVMGCEVITAYDVGAAGVHRLFKPLQEMVEKDVDVIIVVAGREGALPTLVAGMVDVPLIAVPTSYGYGFGGKGVTALMAMLQSCSLGIAVVNIDGGVPAGAVAGLIANRAAKYRKKETKKSSR